MRLTVIIHLCILITMRCPIKKYWNSFNKLLRNYFDATSSFGERNCTAFYIVNDVKIIRHCKCSLFAFSPVSLCSNTGYGMVHRVHAMYPVSLGWLDSAGGRDMLPLTLVLVTSVIAFPSASCSVKQGKGHRVV